MSRYFRPDRRPTVAHPLDATEPSSVETFAAHVTRDLGDIEPVVSHAGAVAPGAVHKVNPEAPVT